MIKPISSMKKKSRGDRHLRILIVDDVAITRDTLAYLLRLSAGYEVVGLGYDGQQGVELAALLHPDLVLMDVRMPVMNGLDATRQIKQQPGAPVVVVMSLDDGAAYRAAAHRVGADAFVDKRDLATTLPELLEKLFHSQAEAPALGGASVPASRTSNGLLAPARPEPRPTVEMEAPVQGYAHAINRILAPASKVGLATEGRR